ncbi:hypothetical protein H6M51_00565 [Rhizobium sp. AQ_MP]|uniref:hypothetical protein n=1 Tax=Rhizobium sp. AQ_MP TaxID=2761536 RepID=UPI00163A7833|nr:hypothetical protein [Rhizobium sp. AQ_MP]MBC2771333.1 hypothetical protein [Rhizobium sp. AQ_MP]
MAEEPRHRSANPAQVRGDIQAGLTGDKRPGFDPAMAPLETDAEAGGVSLSQAEIQTARQEQREGRPRDVSGDSGTAMRSSFSGNRARQGPFWLYFFGLLLIAIIGIGVLVSVYALP